MKSLALWFLSLLAVAFLAGCDTGVPVISSDTNVTGIAGDKINYAITASNDPTSYAATGLPAGLSVDTSSGIISGTLSGSGTTSATISAMNTSGTGSATLVITVLAGPPEITSGTSATGTVRSAFKYTITASNSPEKFDASDLPPGLSVDTNTGIIQGTPTKSGIFHSTISATNVGGTTSAALKLVIDLAPPTGLTALVGSKQVALSWTPEVGATAYNVKRSLTSGTGFTTVVTVSGSSAPVLNEVNGSIYYYEVTGTNSAGESSPSDEVGVMPGAIPSPWETANIGSVGGAIGGVDYSGTTFTMAGSGADIGGKTDEFRYTFQSSGTSGQITARVVGFADPNASAKAGVMIRESLLGNSIYVGCFISASGGAQFEYRSSTGASATISKSVSGVTAPYWVGLVRSGSTFSASISPDGSTWTSLGSIDVTMTKSAFIGLPICSRQSGVLATGTLDNVTVSP